MVNVDSLVEVSTRDALDQIWDELLSESNLIIDRSSFRFDPSFYQDNNPDVVQAGLEPADHYERYGRDEGRPPNLYSLFASTIEDLDERIESLVVHRKLTEAIRNEIDGAHELAFELIALGSPIDEQVSDFSRAYYTLIYPDIKASGIGPFRHFIEFGIIEGRRSLADVRQNCIVGKQKFDPDLPTCLIGVHQLSKTGAPIVGLDLARRAAESHNVIVASLATGNLLADFAEVSCYTVIGANPTESLLYLPGVPVNQIDYAILNSAESHPMVQFCVRYDIGFAAYIHEYAEYTLPGTRRLLTLHADLLVFSSDRVRRTWEWTFDDLSFDLEKDSMVLPQAELNFVQPSTQKYNAARKALTELTGHDCTNRRVVFGAAYAHWRKGTDLFLQAAQLCRRVDPSVLFVWVGDGFNHEDINFGIWVDQQAAYLDANDESSNLCLLPSGTYYNDIRAAADVLFLSSRLDPLPNVVFDAADAGCTTVLFSGATGFDDPGFADHEALSFVDYGDVPQALGALLKAPLKSDGLRVESDLDLRAKPEQQGPTAVFDAIRNELHQSMERVAEAESKTAGKAYLSTYDVSLMFSSDQSFADARNRERVRSWRRGRCFVWPSRSAAESALAETGNWVHSRIKIADFTQFDSAAMALAPAFSIHLHVFTVDSLGSELDKYVAYRHAQRVAVTTGSEAKAEAIRALFEKEKIPNYDVTVFEGRGRDIAPLFALLETDGAPDDLWCHIQLGRPDGRAGGIDPAAAAHRDFAMASILGDSQSVANALIELNDPSVGLTSTFDPIVWGWQGARRMLDTVASRLPGELPRHPIAFPVENLFWVKPATVRAMQKLIGPDFLWPNEPIAGDGTPFRLIERLWPAVAAAEGLNSVFIDKPDQPR